VWCNSVVKFGAMKKFAMEKLGATGIATGHYARLWHGKAKYCSGNNLDVKKEDCGCINRVKAMHHYFSQGQIHQRISLTSSAE